MSNRDCQFRLQLMWAADTQRPCIRVVTTAPQWATSAFAFSWHTEQAELCLCDYIHSEPAPPIRIGRVTDVQMDKVLWLAVFIILETWARKLKARLLYSIVNVWMCRGVVCCCKCVGEEIEDTSLKVHTAVPPCRHSLTRRRRLIPPLSLPLKAENLTRRPPTVCALHT